MDPAVDLTGYSCAIFDCDGVILDSNPVKIAAFRAALADERLHARGNRPYSAFGLRAGSLRVQRADWLHARGNRPYSAFGLRAGSLRVPRADWLHARGNRPYSAFGLRAGSLRVPRADCERVEALIAEHRRTGGVSRYEKLARFYQDHPDPQAAIARALERFAEAAREGLRSCPEVPGVREILSAYSRRGVPIHVVSGGARDEVREALAARGLADLVTGIHGSPTPKHEHLERLRSEGELLPGGVFFGDAELDMELAERFELAFVFVAGVSDWPQGRTVARERGHRVIESFAATRSA